MALPLARRKADDVIQAQSLGTTTTAGLSAAVAGLGGAIVALVPEFSTLDVPIRLQVAGLLVVGLAIVGWSIATAGDALARAYATAHVIDQEDGSDVKKPALPAAVQRLAEAYENGIFGVAGVQNDGSDAKKPALAEALNRLAEAQENSALGIAANAEDGAAAKSPAMASALVRLAEAHENATFGIKGIQNDGSDAKKPALAASIAGLHLNGSQPVDSRFLEAPDDLKHRVGDESFPVVALIFSSEGHVQKLFVDAAGELCLSEPALVTSSQT